VGLLTAAFASVARRGQLMSSRLWLIAWITVMLHFVAAAFLSAPSPWGDFANYLAAIALAWAGMFFTWAAIPYRKQRSSLWIAASLLASTAIYIGLLAFGPITVWALAPAAALFGALPLAVALLTLRDFNHPLRWTTVTIYSGLSIFLLVFQFRLGNPALALNAVYFAIYLSCAIHFWRAHPRASAGAFITIAGFFAWASVFVVGPFSVILLPQLHFESEVWNLPKYVVAVGMILLLLEDQIEHNKYLALHDELTGLPNRRLFLDRLANTLERSRRTGSQTALLQIDLDNFKQVNDSVGHHVGDELLKHVATLFLGRVRRSDTVARTGGDEFSVILEEPMSRADAVRVGRTLSELLDGPFTVNGHTLQVGASVGIAVFPDDANDAESLRIAADLRMYASKHASKAKTAANPELPFGPGSVAVPESHSGLRLAE